MNQRRVFLTPNARLRAQQNDDGTHTVTGYAALTGVISTAELQPGVREMLAPGCFDDCVAAPDLDCTCNINHNDDDYLLGRTTSGTLTLSSDSIGLKFSVQMPDTDYARNLGVLMSRGDMNQCSFAFQVEPGDISVDRKSDTESVEVINKVASLWDVSIVTRGFYSQTFSVYRKVDQILNSKDSTVDEDKPRSTPVENRSIDADIALAKAKLELAVKAIEV